LAEPLGCFINAQDLAGVSRDDFVLIIGGGGRPTGVIHALLARQRGVEKIILSEKMEARHKLAERAVDRGPRRDMVCANAAPVLYISGRASSLREGGGKGRGNNRFSKAHKKA